MSNKMRILIGMAGTFALISSIFILVYAFIAPNRITYGAPSYYSYSSGIAFNTINPPIAFLIAGIALVWVWIVAWKEENKRPYRELFFYVISWIRSNLYLAASILTLIYFTGALVFWWGNEIMASSEEVTLKYGEPSLNNKTQTNYIAFAELTGPDKLYVGTSAEITLTMWIDQGVVAPTYTSSLLPNEKYTVTATLQAVNLEMDEQAVSLQSKQILSTEKKSILELGDNSKREKVRKTDYCGTNRT